MLRAVSAGAALALVPLPFSCLAAEDSAAPQGAAKAPVPVHFVDNFTQTFAVPPGFLWAEMKRMYLDGSKYRDLGFAIEVLPPTAEAPLGGTIASRREGEVVDRVKALFTAIDETNRFLALRVLYNTGITAYVSYDVRETSGGSQMQLIVHAQQPMPETRALPDAETVRREAEAQTEFHYGQLVTIWAAEAQRIETLYRAGMARGSSQ